MIRCALLPASLALVALCNCGSPPSEPEWTHDGTVQAACYYPDKKECIDYLKPLLDASEAEFKSACASDLGKWNEASCPGGYLGSCHMTTWNMHIYDEDRLDKAKQVCASMGEWTVP